MPLVGRVCAEDAHIPKGLLESLAADDLVELFDLLDVDRTGELRPVFFQRCVSFVCSLIVFFSGRDTYVHLLK